MSILTFLRGHQKAFLAVGMVALLVAAGLAAGLAITRRVNEPAATTLAFSGETLSLSQATGASLVDTDRDGLPDVVENFVYGSDPVNWSSGDNGVPDGWFAAFGFDPTEPGIASRPAAVPDPTSLPPVYLGEWPPAYSWTLAEAYRAGRPGDWNESTNDPWRNDIDPRTSAAPAGLPYAWLHHYGLVLTDPSVPTSHLSGNALSVRDAFEADTDPRKSDTDGDGLTDRDEIELYHTHPQKVSTSGTGIPDGWLVRFGLDAADPTIGSQDPVGKGMSIKDVFLYNEKRFTLAGALDGQGLDPTKSSTLGTNVPDGWLVRFALDPLSSETVQRVVSRASEYPLVRNLVSAPPGKSPIVDLVLSVLDYYGLDRPTTWDEKTQGPWLGGLDPSRSDHDGDGLPDAVELRGWFANVTVGLGPEPLKQPYIAHSDPTVADSDGDTLTDHEEYLGRATRNGTVFAWEPTDPSAADTAFSGMSDAEKVFGPFADGRRTPLVELDAQGNSVPLLDPTRMDSDRDYLSDGDELHYWQNAASAASRPYQDRFSGSHHASYEAWVADMGGATPPVDAAEVAALLLPTGNIDGDDLANIVDDDSDQDGIADGFEATPTMLVLSEFPSNHPRAPSDAANADTDGDGLRDGWELRYGEWNDTFAGWDLDPTKYRSAPTGSHDGLVNLDLDGADWFAFTTGTESVGEARRFDFHNLLEQEEGTDPRLADENGDGVEEGWVVFWRDLYPLRVNQAVTDSTAREDVGFVVPTAGQFAARASILVDPLEDVGSETKQTIATLRFFEVLSADLAAALLLPGETLAVDPPLEINVLRSGTLQQAIVAKAVGENEHVLSVDAQLGLNPYLVDTDGDGMTDAWETHNGRCITSDARPADPTVPDAIGDPDQDGLTNEAEFSAGTMPCIHDTDLGGVRDGVEENLGFLSPIDPGDDAESTPDSAPDDGDGLDVQAELAIGTDPTDPDSDGDGLLDGADLPMTLAGMSAATIALNTSLAARGIAHTIELAPGGLRIRYLGESDAGSSPILLDSSDDGIPDGWAAYYTGRADLSISHFARYACGRPAWWDEATLGVWWWGIPPTGTETCGADIDFDGLDDNKGDDPIPAASHNNSARTTPALPTALDSGLVPLALLKAGQGFGDCAGDPRPCRLAWPTLAYKNGRLDSVNRATTALTLTTLGLSQETGTKILPKETPFQLTGQLRCATACADKALPKRTIALELHQGSSAPRLLGLAFTNVNGDFSMTAACLCTNSDLTIPEVGMVALGHSSGTVSWSSEPQSIPNATLGTLVLRAYATTATLGGTPALDAAHPLNVTVTQGGNTYHATGASTLNVGNAKITATTLLTFDAPDRIPFAASGRTLPVSVALVDASGAGIRGADIIVTASGLQPQTVRTVTGGTATATFAIPDARTTTVIVGASFPGSATGGLSAAPAGGTQAVPLQIPITLSVDPLAEPVRVGRSLTVNVTVRSGGVVASGIPLRGVLGAFVATAISDDGVAMLVFQTNGVEPPSALVRFDVDETVDHTAATASLTVPLVTGVALTTSLPAVVQVGVPLRVDGRLALASGAPLEHELIVLQLGSVVVNSTVTRADGTFRFIDNLSANTEAGLSKLSVTYVGVQRFESDGQAILVERPFQPAVVEREVRVVVATKVEIIEAAAARNSTVVLQGFLTQASHRPLAGHRVNVSVDSKLVGRALADYEGRFKIEFVVPDDARLGDHVVRADFDGSKNLTYAATTGLGTLRVGTTTLLSVVTTGPFERGNNTVIVSLRTENGEGVADAPILISTTPGTNHTATTDSAGLVRITAQFPLPMPGQDVRIDATFLGDVLLAPDETNATVPLRVPTKIELAHPSTAGRGTPFRIRYSLVDDAGNPVSGQPVAATLAGATTTGLSGPNSELVLDVPLDTSLGVAILEVRYGGAAHHLATHVERNVTVKEGVVLTVTNTNPSTREGEPMVVGLRLTDAQGTPLGGRTVGLRVEVDAVAVLVVTDDDGNATAVLLAPHAGMSNVFAFFAGDEVLASQSVALPLEVASIPAASPPPNLWWLAVAFAALGAGLLVVFVASRLRRVPTIPGILREVDSRIAAGDPWQATVLLAYRRLTVHVGRLGFRERKSETVREFVDALARRIQLPTESAISLVALVEAARYGGERGTPEEAQWARLMLRELVTAVDARIRESRQPQSTVAEVA